MKHRREEEFAELRRRAEALLHGRFEDEGAIHESFKPLPDLIHELEVCQVELEMQNDELRQSEQRLEASEKKYADLYNFAPVGYFTFDGKGTILEANLTGAGLLGVERQPLIGTPFPAHCTPESADRFYLHLRSVLKTRKSETCELTLIGANGTSFEAQLESVAAENEHGALSLCQSAVSDITERKRAEAEQEMTIGLMHLINSSATTIELIRNIACYIKTWSGMEAVGIRLRKGDDFPYYESRGFPEEFVQLESSLHARDRQGEPARDSDGNPLLECMCGRIIQGRCDPAKPFFTEHGSFWSNSTSELVASLTETDRLELGPMRIRCVGAGYESMALIPLHFRDETVGLLQLVDKAKDRFTPRLVSFLEHLADSIAIALAQRQAEKATHESEQRFHTLFSTMNEAFVLGEILLDAEGKPCDWRYLEVNPAFERQTGIPVAQALGRRVREILPDIERLPIETYGKVALTGEPAHLEYYVKELGRYLEVYAYCPTPGRFAAVFLDVTARKQTEELLRRQGEQLVENDRRKNEFLSMLAHELRNPLAPIRNAVQLLEMGASDEQSIKRHRKMIERQVGHMSRLLDDLLDISRITEGKITLKNEKLDLRAVVDRAIDTSAPFVNEHRHSLYCNPLPEPLWLEGDGARLEQIVCNLLNNATKYTETGGQIWVTLERDASADDSAAPLAILRVRDSGFGIEPDMLPLVFDLFTQAERSLARAEGGLGIGLNLVRRLVEMHGGTIQAHSAGLGQGSEFIVRLPLLPEPEAKPVTPECREAAVTELETNVSAGSARKVLVVDDNVDGANSLGELLELWGYLVRMVYDGHAVLAAALDFRPDVVLLDLGLPGLSGCEVVTLLRTEPSLVGTAIIALTGYGQAEDRRQALEAGFDDHLTKPVDLRHLEVLLRQRPARG